MNAAALIISILALLTSVGGLWFARSQAHAAHSQADAAKAQVLEAQRQTVLAETAAQQQAVLAELQAELIHAQANGTRQQIEAAQARVAAAQAASSLQGLTEVVWSVNSYARRMIESFMKGHRAQYSEATNLFNAAMTKYRASAQGGAGAFAETSVFASVSQYNAELDRFINLASRLTRSVEARPGKEASDVDLKNAAYLRVAEMDRTHGQMCQLVSSFAMKLGTSTRFLGR